YEAFGQLLSSTGNTDNTYRFTGEQYDAGLDQYYLRARYYSQNSGRFTQQDTWMGRNNDPITLHKYLYANADPANGIDPSGHSGLFSFSTAMNISARLATTAIANYPRATSLVQIAAQVATPLELAALSPVSAGLVGGGTVGLAALRHLDKAENLAKSSFWLNRIGSGNEFEKFVAKLIGQKVNTQAILNGGSAAGRPAGSAIPDFFFRGGILEAKLTGAAVTKNQLQQYARYVGDGGNITYMFKQKPTPSQISTMERWLKESKFDAVLQVAYVFE
ncbi:MAG: RHS repeat-associated core domain-containing protein, partial [Gammaproteobacteria bacterium]|nr:RHS repeat-associated core domain-containing protein [Gammaproteobacteria bacterium]